MLGTTHYDSWPNEDWSGYSEYAERDFAGIAYLSGYVVSYNAENFMNYESLRGDDNGTHIWLSNGYATFVRIP